MYIRELAVKNYLVHKNTSLALSPISVFVGPNGGGKSAFFDAILNFSMVARGSLRQAFGHFPYSFHATKFHGASPQSRIRFDVVLSNCADGTEQLRYEIDYAQRGNAEANVAKFQIFHERLTESPSGRVLFDRSDIDTSPLRNAVRFIQDDKGIFAALRTAYLSGAPETEFAAISDVAREISRFNRFRLTPYDLASSGAIPDLTSISNPPRLGHTGEYLAACLYYMHEKGDPAIESILAQIREAVPGFSGFEFTFSGSDRVAFSMRFDDSRGVVTAVRLSDGLLLFVGLMVLTYSPNRPPVMLIEEPENGLTPTSLKRFYQAIRGLAFAPDQTKRSQILLSSHSPFVICEAWNGEDRDFIYQVKTERGQAVVRKFSEAVENQGIVLGRDEQHERTVLGLRNAEELMAGYLA
jgi:predicted ATPase